MKRKNIIKHILSLSASLADTTPAESEEWHLFNDKYQLEKSCKRLFIKRFLFTAASVAAVVVVVLSVIGVLDRNRRHLIEHEIGQPLAHYQIIQNECEEALLYDLPDGSRVFLNKGAVLMVDHEYNITNRDLMVIAKAHFDVACNLALPMKIGTNRNVSVMVTGTQFYLDTKYEEDNFSLILTQGNVLLDLLNEDRSIPVAMKAGEKVVLDTLSNFVIEPYAEVPEDTYVQNWFDFSEAEMRDVADKVEEYFGVNISFRERKTSKYLFTGNLNDLTLQQILNLFEAAMFLKCEVCGDTIVIR